MSLAQIARGLIGRPDVGSCPAAFRFGKPILDCDTKSHADGARIFKALEDAGLLDDSSPEELVVLMCLGDGQSMLQAARLKRKDPDRYRHILILCGNFHAFGHFMFAGHESYFDCFTGFFVVLLHKDKVPKLIPNFENDSYKHVLEFLLPLAIGTRAFFQRNVTQPPPELLVSDPMLYLSMLESSGGVVAFRFCQYVGDPVLHWLRAGRKSDGDKCETLHAIAFHMNRATTHKINCVMISLLALLSTVCTHDKVSEIVRAMVSGTFTGKVGSLMWCDRMQEYVNLLQDQRDGKYAAFERSLHYSQDIEALLHVAQMWDDGGSSLHDPVRQSILDAAEVVRAKILELLGSDLTIPSDKNPFWHTGNPVKLASGSAQKHRPWEYVQAVADGRSAGKGRIGMLQAWTRHIPYTSHALYASLTFCMCTTLSCGST